MRKCGSVYRDEYKANIDLPSPTQDELQTRPRQGSHLGHKDAETTSSRRFKDYKWPYKQEGAGLGGGRVFLHLTRSVGILFIPLPSISCCALVRVVSARVESVLKPDLPPPVDTSPTAASNPSFPPYFVSHSEMIQAVLIFNTHGKLPSLLFTSDLSGSHNKA
jgi:hypothetical protein